MNPSPPPVVVEPSSAPSASTTTTASAAASSSSLRALVGRVALTGLMVAAGGGVGAALRWALSLGWQGDALDRLWWIIVVNILGCLFMGVLAETIAHSRGPHSLVAAFLGPGLLGGFTTFSTVMVASLEVSMMGHPWTAALHMGLNLVLSVVAIVVGMFSTALVLDRKGAKQ